MLMFLKGLLAIGLIAICLFILYSIVSYAGYLYMKVFDSFNFEYEKKVYPHWMNPLDSRFFGTGLIVYAVIAFIYAVGASV